MVGIEFSDLQRFLIKWALGTTAVMTLAALILGVISI
jgi:citrate-Mg2+:H+ or citrate-Ca2+:H+ symporter, CitMHS family